MEDSENTFPSSKKRAAEQELSRGTPHHDEKDSCYLATGTYRETQISIALFSMVAFFLHATITSVSCLLFAPPNLSTVKLAELGAMMMSPCSDSHDCQVKELILKSTFQM
ncbi:mannan endo-1,4-beta-mannosidase [Trifolium repens]|nr:mannan endo-1,4-beta-mannosidase [Trifolium repens]